jgi:hypothetical protein
MSDSAGKIGGSFPEHLTRLYESVREAGPQETLSTVRRLGQELGSQGVDRFIHSFQSLTGEDKTFLKNLFEGRAADPDTAAAGAKHLFTREMEGQFRHKRLETHIQDAGSRPPDAAAPASTGHPASRMASEMEKNRINPQPEPPGDFRSRATAAAAHKLAEHLEQSALGPQPEPPDDASPSASAAAAHHLNIHLEQRALGPQPEPPDNASPRASADIAHKLAEHLQQSALGPQPEPPDNASPWASADIAHRLATEMADPGINPQPEPPIEKKKPG